MTAPRSSSARIPDNLANIPADRYQQVNGAPPPDGTTLATGDGGKAGGLRCPQRRLSRGPGRPAAARIDFAGSPQPTLGVEWEFALVDAKTRDLSNGPRP